MNTSIKKNLNLLGMYLRLKMHRTNIFLDNLEKKGKDIIHLQVILKVTHILNLSGKLARSLISFYAPSEFAKYF